MPSILSINIGEKKGVVKKNVEKGYFKINHGLVGDIHAGKLDRQVSLLAQESIDKIKKSGIDGFCTVKFTENLTTFGLDLYKLSVGTKMKIGEAVLEITEVGKQCHKGCERRKLQDDCVMTMECVFAKVLSSGWIKKGDKIEIV
ncbi:MOSC domain-containing protein [Clostridium sp. JS66]|uniref:MOSC domain-containing protein n=1 Tax=Clostridium sp. JS66 TaxID=3064705 RepID=UPI00298E35DD|nr:MOSC domain-containing protein [Clostridium sp. JS66]WPC43670.1 MOSC domain-containing protein [Clostridium sp. JS66]